jgi:hypothetical protein
MLTRLMKRDPSLKRFLKEMEKHSLRQGFESFTRDMESYDKTKANLTFHSLSDVLEMYHDEIVSYYGIEEYEFYYKNSSHYEIVCLLDISDDKVHTMKPELRRRYRRAGKYRRQKLEDKYHYNNPLNRIHAYIIMEISPGFTGKDTLGINVVCSSNYSDIKGLGSYTMTSVISCAKKAGFKDIVLEVGNSDAASIGESSEESDEESDEESEEVSDASGEESGEEEDFEELINEVACALWKKSVRHQGSHPYYSVDENYLRTIISEYLYNQEPGWIEPDTNLDEEYGYGGYYYQKGKRASQNLMRYYESFGFIEDPIVHIEKKCFSDVPFPSMCLTL